MLFADNAVGGERDGADNRRDEKEQQKLLEQECFSRSLWRQERKVRLRPGGERHDPSDRAVVGQRFSRDPRNDNQHEERQRHADDDEDHDRQHGSRIRPEFAQLLRDQGPDPVAADHDGCDDEETSEADDISRRYTSSSGG